MSELTYYKTKALLGGEALVVFRAEVPFYVDGVRYDRHAPNGVSCPQSLASLKPDDTECEDGCRCRCPEGMVLYTSTTICDTCWSELSEEEAYRRHSSSEGEEYAYTHLCKRQHHTPMAHGTVQYI